MGRDTYLRGSKQIDQRLTATGLDRIADWLDLADSQTVASVYPEIPESQDHETLANAWMWTALLIADAADFPTDVLHKLATAIRGAYRE
jgi:poly(3-hydroxybutyrate) depolymerase